MSRYQDFSLDGVAPLAMPGPTEVREHHLRPGQIDALHIGVTAAALAAGSMLSLLWMGDAGAALGAAIGFLCIVGLLFGRHVRLVLGDLYRQFQYREKFALFLVHATVLVVARYGFGIDTWGVLVGILLVMLSFQAVDRLWYSRLYLVSVAGVFGTTIVAGNTGYMPVPGLVAVWFFLILLSIRIGHVRFRMEEEGTGRGIGLRTLLAGSLPGTVIPPLVGWIAFLIAMPQLTPHAISFDLEPAETEPLVFIIPPARAFWAGILLVVVSVTTLALLNWLEKQLRRRRKSVDVSGDMPNVAARRYKAGEALDESPATLSDKGPRERILQAFRRFSRDLAAANLQRREAETVEDYLVRLSTGREQTAARQASPIFNAACYLAEEVNEEEAEQFVALLEQEKDRVLQEMSES